MIDHKFWVKAVAIMSLLAFTILHVMPAASQDNDTIAFVNVNVIPMDEERVLEDQTVIVQGARIVEIGGVGAVSVPPGAQIIEGNGGYLIPGLTDTHFHTLDNMDSLVLAIANGVTTVRDPNADYVGTGKAILNARDKIAAGEMLGPTIKAAWSFIGPSAQVLTLVENVDKVVGPWLSGNWGDALPHWVSREIREVKPDVIIHAAAISSIDKCEQDLEQAILVNTRGANVVFEAADEIIGKGKVVLLSSEQVFDGRSGYYKETDVPHPINDYGRTKDAAEGLASLYDDKVLRLSRGICASDTDIAKVMKDVSENRVPEFLLAYTGVIVIWTLWHAVSGSTPIALRRCRNCYTLGEVMCFRFTN